VEIVRERACRPERVVEADDTGLEVLGGGTALPPPTGPLATPHGADELVGGTAAGMGAGIGAGGGTTATFR